MEELLLPRSRAAEESSSGPFHEENHFNVTNHCSSMPWLPKYTSQRHSLLSNSSLLVGSNYLKRSHSAPCPLTTAKGRNQSSDDKSHGLHSSPSTVWQAAIGIVLYMATGVAVYLAISTCFKGHTTYGIVDALYFIVATLCTVGYGDIVPCTDFSKLFTCAFILVGFGFIDVLLNRLVTYILDKQEAVLLSTVDESRHNMVFTTYVMDTRKGRMRVRMKVALALGIVSGCIALGMVMVHLLEGLNWVDSFYFSVTSVTTVGYGDYTFQTLCGRLFATAWLLISTLTVARAFLFLAELRIDKRNREILKWVLQKKLTAGDLVAADLDKDGRVSKSEFVLYKLKEMGKVSDIDIMQICDQFDKLDAGNCGKITLSDLCKSSDNE